VYETQTEKVIIDRMLASITDDTDKKEGSATYKFIAPGAVEITQLYVELDNTVKKLDINNLSGEELTLRVYQRTGVIRKGATYSTKYLNVLGTGDISIGDLFQTESRIQFVATENKSIVGAGTVNIKAVVPSSSGNVPANTIVFIPVSIDGIISVTNPEPTSEGYDEESDESLLERYYERLATPATSGNKAHYINWAKEVAGVGDAKVISRWNGDNTVKVIIINVDKITASIELVDAVQEYIDPGATGDGDGEAPIGAKCTVVSAVAKILNVSFVAVKDPAYPDEQILANVEKKISEYYKSIAFKDGITSVSYALVGNAILNSIGILDYSNLIVNGGTANIPLETNEVPVSGVVTIA
jgi:uncharacterized phage protein gp47/JayE